MMHSFIVYGSNQENRHKKIQDLLNKYSNSKFKDLKSIYDIEDPNILVLSPSNSIGIDEIRKLKKFISFKSTSESKIICIISPAEKLTQQAQHALLKTLEEPNPHSLLLLELNNPNKLLLTILSRCQLIRLTNQKTNPTSQTDEKYKELTDKFLENSPTERILLVSNLSNPQEAKNFLLYLLLYFKTRLKENPKLTKHLVLVHDSLKSIDKNVNTRLVLEHLSINL